MFAEEGGIPKKTTPNKNVKQREAVYDKNEEVKEKDYVPKVVAAGLLLAM